MDGILMLSLFWTAFLVMIFCFPEKMEALEVRAVGSFGNDFVCVTRKDSLLLSGATSKRERERGV
jgi:hypothetical protein